MMKPPSKNTRRSMRAPPVLAIITVLQTPAMTLKSPAAICWIKNTSNSCLKNLERKRYRSIRNNKNICTSNAWCNDEPAANQTKIV